MSYVRVALGLILCVLFVHCEYLNKKFCDDADLSQCQVYSVMLDPCSDGGNFCTIKRTKQYTLSVDFLPKFSAQELDLSLYGDDSNTGAFDKVVKAPTNACHMLTCPVQKQMRRIFDIDFSLGKTFVVTKFPIKVKLYNPSNVTQVCCFTFNVKIMK